MIVFSGSHQTIDQGGGFIQNSFVHNLTVFRVYVLHLQNAFINCHLPFQEGVTDADVYPDIKFRLTYEIVKKTPPAPSGPTDVPSLVPYSVLDPSKPQEATALVCPHMKSVGHCADFMLLGLKKEISKKKLRSELSELVKVPFLMEQ